jgi:hypothetical protein
VREEVHAEAQRCQDVLAEVQAEEIPQGSQSMTLTRITMVMTITGITVVMTTIARILITMIATIAHKDAPCR